MTNRQSLLEQLTQAFCYLPGVGKKSAQRMVMSLLENNREGGQILGETLIRAMSEIKNCSSCRTFTEHETCELCLDSRRDKSLLCVVESPADIHAIEQSDGFKGSYFVLMGRLSPIDGVGPEEIGIPQLIDKVKQDGVSEVIIATNPTIEGEATSYYISEALKEVQVKASRIAHGIPLGGELGYVDSHTINHAFTGRRNI